MIENFCIICGIKILKHVKTCSTVCRKKHNNERQKNRKSHSFNCLNCLKQSCSRKKNTKFCSISCSSYYHIKIGSYDQWKNHKNKKLGTIKKCGSLLCSNNIYHQPHEINIKYCSKQCKNIHMGVRFAGKLNPFYGKTLSDKAKEQIKQTLLLNYGTDNPLTLLRNYRISKPQKEISDFLLKNNIKTELEFPLKINKKLFYIDIFLPEFNIGIEYNGDYWHCNPTFYQKDFLHPKKKITACAIWQNDENRKNCFSTKNIKTIVIWESNFKRNKEVVLLELLNEIKNGK